ncbi:hypothetical protein GQX74_013050 [Glossina fuscipes]|nr:hypothetical protein GQX74_013050 [Glossina fuscipes]
MDDEEEAIAMLNNLKSKNRKHSVNFLNTIHNPAHGTEIHQNQSISNHSLAQSLTDNMSIDELLASFESLYRGHKLENFLLLLLKIFQTQQKCKASIRGEEPQTNAAVISNRIAHVNQLALETTPNTSHNLTTQTITSSFYPDRSINRNQYSTTDSTSHQLFYPANSNTYMQRYVQLSEAIVFKHLREHQKHHSSETAEGNLKNNILAAIQQIASKMQSNERASNLMSTDLKSNEETIAILQEELKSADETEETFSNERRAEDTEIVDEEISPFLCFSQSDLFVVWVIGLDIKQVFNTVTTLLTFWEGNHKRNMKSSARVLLPLNSSRMEEAVARKKERNKKVVIAAQRMHVQWISVMPSPNKYSLLLLNSENKLYRTKVGTSTVFQQK